MLITNVAHAFTVPYALRIAQFCQRLCAIKTPKRATHRAIQNRQRKNDKKVQHLDRRTPSLITKSNPLDPAKDSYNKRARMMRTCVLSSHPIPGSGRLHPERYAARVANTRRREK